MSERIIDIEKALDAYLPEEEDYPTEIHKSMRYSMFSGGKRLRPLLVLAAAEMFGVSQAKAMPVACALEMVHTYSLIHDDLPALDNDDFRRGRHSNHKVFGEAIALLAGDALLTTAFRVLAEEGARHFAADIVVRLIQELGEAAGTTGMIGGQVVDLLSEGKKVSADTLDYIHSRKTGSLIACCIRSGAVMGKASEAEVERLTRFSLKIGLAFQVVDDILDVTGDEKKLGKKVGQDEYNQKNTYPSLFGVEKARALAVLYQQQAENELACFGKRAAGLTSLGRLLVNRDF